MLFSHEFEIATATTNLRQNERQCCQITANDVRVNQQTHEHTRSTCHSRETTSRTSLPPFYMKIARSKYVSTLKWRENIHFRLSPLSIRWKINFFVALLSKCTVNFYTKNSFSPSKSLVVHAKIIASELCVARVRVEKVQNWLNGFILWWN